MYRQSLKEVLARETALKPVIRDREILANRLIKIGNKKPKDGYEREHQQKLDDAQRELRACEAFLQEEEGALAHVKRLSFREALNNRMKEMGHLARVMEDTAAEAVAVLDSLSAPYGDYTPSTRHFDLASDDGSIAPSQSASQAMSRMSSSSSLRDEDGVSRHMNGPRLPDNLHIDPNARPTSVVRRERSFSPSRAPDTLTAISEAAPSTAGTAPDEQAPTGAAQSQPDRPVMPAVPTAPPPVSQTVYTERTPGMPTFEIPRAPDLSRRPDYSSESEYDDDEGRPHGGRGYGTRSNVSRLQGQSSRRSMRFSSVPAPALSFSQRSSYGRRAMSESGSIDGREGGGRKRRGSFFGGLANLFRRNKNKDRDEEEEEPETDYLQRSYGSRTSGRGGGGAGGYREEPTYGDQDYAVARNRLARQQSSATSVRSRNTTAAHGGGGGAADARADAVMESVMNAGLTTNRRTRRDSTDDEEPANVVRHVNDPKLRQKATSDVGRSPPARPTITVQHPSYTGRPKLHRKGTGSSSIRPGGNAAPVAAAEAPALGPPKQQKKPRKAASDIGVPPSQWNGPMPSSTSSPALQVPRAPSGPGISELANGSMLPLARPSGPAFAPRNPNTGTPAAPAETGTLTRKQTKKGKVDPREAQLASIVASVGTVPVRPRQTQQQQQPETVVLSAESLGIPTSTEGGAAATTTQAAPTTQAKPSLTRSNTATSGAGPAWTNGTGEPARTVKKKKSKSAADTPPASAPPSADDLAASLPHASTGPSSFSAQLPRPDDDPTAFKPGHPLSIAPPVTTSSAPAPAATAPNTTETIKKADGVKPVRARADKEKKAKHMSSLHGVGDSSWVSQPGSTPQSQAQAGQQPQQQPRAMPTPPRRSDVHKGDESLMSIVDIAEGNENVKVSRSYASNSGTSTPASSTLAVPSTTTTTATTGRATPSWLSGGAHVNGGSAPRANGASTGSGAMMAPPLSSRKSVRLAEVDPNARSAALSPSPSMRSTSSGATRPGILRPTSPSPGSVTASLSNGRDGGGDGAGSAHGSQKEDFWPTRATLRKRMQDSDDSSDEGEGMKAYRAARKALGRNQQMDGGGASGATREPKGKGRASD
ncbi:hypothetical protein JCM8202v2_000689 [Rhodotorula sphaerocarpa]